MQMNDDELDERMAAIRYLLVEKWDLLTETERLKIAIGLAMGVGNTVHYFLHGKKRGATYNECSDSSCQIVAALERRYPLTADEEKLLTLTARMREQG